MKEELQSKLVEILTSIQTAAGKASDFAMEQLPDIAQSYVAYGRTAAVAWLLFSVCAVALCAWLTRLLWVSGQRAGDFSEILAVFPAGASVAASVWMAHSINSAALVWMAPKVWLLKEIAGLIR